ncbi:hypothetical protein E2562_035520 [Oryza meyeriana var. granulata]|uniref:Uncharacterized protein n=1 Tax=Oryza meyeriana var. granulata TaxID=110450 RepID=A0A6G1DAE6_9ORYZ|nr:hypothetical protein E2562_035520 [Oryza meyeriana var. granulata]
MARVVKLVRNMRYVDAAIAEATPADERFLPHTLLFWLDAETSLADAAEINSRLGTAPPAATFFSTPIQILTSNNETVKQLIDVLISDNLDLHCAIIESVAMCKDFVHVWQNHSQHVEHHGAVMAQRCSGQSSQLAQSGLGLKRRWLWRLMNALR